jgi:hypothetical protein
LPTSSDPVDRAASLFQEKEELTRELVAEHERLTKRLAEVERALEMVSGITVAGVTAAAAAAAATTAAAMAQEEDSWPLDLSDPELKAPHVIVKCLQYAGSWASSAQIFGIARNSGCELSEGLLYSAISRMAQDGRLATRGAKGAREYRIA